MHKGRMTYLIILMFFLVDLWFRKSPFYLGKNINQGHPASNRSLIFCSFLELNKDLEA